MQKTVPELGPDQQDKRMVVPIELGDVDTWVNGSQEDVSVRVKFAPAAVFDAGPVAP